MREILTSGSTRGEAILLRHHSSPTLPAESTSPSFLEDNPSEELVTILVSCIGSASNVHAPAPEFNIPPKLQCGLLPQATGRVVLSPVSPVGGGPPSVRWLPGRSPIFCPAAFEQKLYIRALEIQPSS